MTNPESHPVYEVLPDMPAARAVHYEASQRPGIDDSYLANYPYELSTYRIEDHQIKAHDAAWGDAIFSHEKGDDILLELAVHDVIARLQAVEQLSNPPHMTTIAGMSSMPRWDHAWGPVILVGKFGKMLGLSPEEIRKKQVRALLSDAPQWGHSHLGDWMLQGMGGPEDAHDRGQARFLEAVGVAKILQDNGYRLEDMLVSSDVEPWEECPKPNLNIDNLDYIARQSLRMFGGVPEFAEEIKTFPFEINEDGNVVVTSLKLGRMLTKAAMLLPTEHWQEPTQRFLLIALQEMVRHDIVRYGPSTAGFYFEGDGLNPRDALMSVDCDYATRSPSHSPFIWAFADVACQVAAERRNIYRLTRAELLNKFVADREPMAIPDPMVPGGLHGWRHPLFPLNLEIVEVPVSEESQVEAGMPDFKQNPHTVDFFMPFLKRRYIDPLVRLPNGNVGQLSKTEGNEDIAILLEEQGKILDRNYVARLLVNPDYKKIIETGIKENTGYWKEQLKNPRLSPEDFARWFQDVANLGKAARKSQIEWWR